MTAEAPQPDVFAHRRAARRRMWICPGGGFAYLGRPTASLLTYLASLGVPLSATVAAWRPTAPLIGATLALFAAALFMFALEATATYTSWTAAETPAAAYRPWRRLLLLTGAVALFGGVVLTSYGVLQIRGDGMLPTFHDEERLLYRKWLPFEDLRVGQLILFRLDEDNKPMEPGTYMLGRILALPGDEISIRGDTYYVNGKASKSVAPSEPYSLAVNVLRQPRKSIVPGDCYFVVQDSIDEGLDSRVLSWARRDRIVSTRIFTFDGTIIPRQVE